MNSDDGRFRLLIALIVVPSMLFLTSYALVACGETSSSTSGQSNAFPAPTPSSPTDSPG